MDQYKLSGPKKKKKLFILGLRVILTCDGNIFYKTRGKDEG